uniref:Uncharacterized protein LOC104265947 n=1 Tax=Phallusia mammillata TaxID=59560 RepID=A0A6F9DJH7_9ASCI|nr:uncharacterized protein LOC104265947 [Phallusia mammillata]
MPGSNSLYKASMFREKLIEYMQTNVRGYALIDLLTYWQECSDDEKNSLTSNLPGEFDFCNTSISSSAAQALAEILPRLDRPVTRLDLRLCNLNLDKLRVICGGISEMKHRMEELYLSQNEFGNAGVEIISGCLRNLELGRLDLRNCGISPTGLEGLCGEIELLDIPMKYLDLSENEFGNAEVEIISAFGFLRKVEWLGLQHCGISDDGKQILRMNLETLGLPRPTVDFDL